MRDDLEADIFRRWPELYRLRDARPTRMGGFEHGGGWWAIIDALSGTVTGLSREAGQPVPPAFWSKEKFGTLRWSLAERASDPSLGQAIDGAEAVAERASAAVCEETGEPGCMWSLGSWWATCSPARVAAWESEDVGRRRGKALCRLRGEGGRRAGSWLYHEDGVGDGVAEWSPADTGAFGGAPEVEVPRGMTDVADSLLRVLGDRGWQQPPSGLLRALRWTEEGGFEAMPVPGAVLSARDMGALRMASALAVRTDRDTGSMRPPAPEARA